MSDSSSVVSGIEASRLKGVTIVKPIVYGNHSQHFGKKREPDGHTHDWTVYVKPFNNEDMSSYVKKVQFKLDFPEEKLDNGPEKKRKRIAENGTTRNGKKNFAFYGKVCS